MHSSWPEIVVNFYKTQGAENQQRPIYASAREMQALIFAAL